MKWHPTECFCTSCVPEYRDVCRELGEWKARAIHAESEVERLSKEAHRE